MPGPLQPSQVADKLPTFPDSADLLVGLGLLLGERPALHDWMHAIAADPAQVATASYWHANGFAKLVLHSAPNCRIRLHVWPAGPAPRGEWDPHGHRWDFASTVLVGEGLDIVEYEEVQRGIGIEHTRYVYDGGLVPKAVVGLSALRRSEVLRGQCYATDTTVIHTVEPKGVGLVATLLVQGPHVNSDAPVYGAQPGARVDRPSRPVTEQDVRGLVRDVLGALEPGGAALR